MGSSFTNFLATSLHILGLTFSVIRVVVILLFLGSVYKTQHLVTDFTLILNDIIYFVTFLLVLSKPRFFESNRSFWFGFAVALANDVILSILVLGYYIHPLVKVVFMFQLGFNLVVMTGSFFELSLFLPQSKSKQVPPPIAFTPMQAYQSHASPHPAHPPIYTSPIPTMSPLPPNLYKS